MALGKQPYRKAFPHRVKVFRAVSTECERLIAVHMQRGLRSTPTGLVDADPEYLALDMRRTEAEVLDLLAEGHKAGLLVWSQAEGWAYIVGAINDDPPGAENNWKGYHAEILLAPPSEAREAALLAVGTWFHHTPDDKGFWVPPPNPHRTPSEPRCLTRITQEQEPVPDPVPDPDPKKEPGPRQGPMPRQGHDPEPVPVSGAHTLGGGAGGEPAIRPTDPEHQDAGKGKDRTTRPTGRSLQNSATLAQHPPTEPPTLEMVRAYFRESAAGTDAEAEKCFLYWKPYGWRESSGNPLALKEAVEEWRSALRWAPRATGL